VRRACRPLPRLPPSSFDTQDGLYDVAWSEVHENQLVTGSGDGSLKLWDITLAVSRPCRAHHSQADTLQDHPIRMWAEHQREVFSVDWNNLKKEMFASSSWDASVRVVSRRRSDAQPSHLSCRG